MTRRMFKMRMVLNLSVFNKDMRFIAKHGDERLLDKNALSSSKRELHDTKLLIEIGQILPLVDMYSIPVTNLLKATIGYTASAKTNTLEGLVRWLQHTEKLSGNKREKLIAVMSPAHIELYNNINKALKNNRSNRRLTRLLIEASKQMMRLKG